MGYGHRSARNFHEEQFLERADSPRMLSLLLFAQLSVSAPKADSTYSTAALRSLVARAAVENHRPPAELRSYSSHVETEVALMLRDTLGRERSAEMEQMATNATWDRGGRYDLHIVGYRSQSVGVPYSTLSIIRAWTVPTLYGERLSLGAYFTRTNLGDTLIAVHPFAADRDRYYRFSGGDTVASLHAGNRTIQIVRVRVHPAFQSRTPLGAFDGEIDLDAERGQIIRMRGQFMRLGPAASKREALSKWSGMVAVAYIEFVNAEIGGKYWLPSFQRTEFQASFPLFGQTRPIFRIVSTISAIAVNDTGAVTPDTIDFPRVIVSWAPTDSVNRFADWQRDLGTQTASVHSDDFADMAPDEWRSDGPPRLDMFPNSTARIIRFNRVEGLYTGVAPTVNFRSAAPGLSVGADAGWAWTEKTVRGGAFVNFTTQQWTYGLRAERSLESTNDFVLPFSQDPGVGAILNSIDPYDYVDRRTAMASVTRVLRSVDVGVVTLQLGGGSDNPERARLSHGLIPGGAPFRPNRGAAAGSYAIGRADLEFHPNVTGDFVEPGLGMRAHYEAASGTLNWQRAELSLSARKYFGPVSLAAHADGGLLFGAAPPPQTLFELGGSQSLEGYQYKQFAGDRAALFRTFASYRFDLWKRPWHFWRNYYLPGISPGVAVSAQGGWTEISSPGVAQAVRELGLDANGNPVSTATGGVRATIGGGLTLFSDIVHIGIARPVDRPAPWRFVIGFGPAF